MKNIYKTLAVICALAGTVSCHDLRFGEDFLEKAPGVDVTIDTIFSCKKYADRALNAAYQSVPMGLVLVNGATDGEIGAYDYQEYQSSMGNDCLDAITDIVQSSCEWGGCYGMYYNGGYNPSSEDGSGSTKFSYNPDLTWVWQGIRRAYIYLDNVDRVPDMTEEEKTLRKAEAKLIIALNYMVALRHIGGVPIFYDLVNDENQATSDFSRKTVQQVLDFVLNLCDEAAEVLPWQVADIDFGRCSKGAALALKARLLLFCASPLFNASEPYCEPNEPNAQNRDKVTEDVKLMAWMGDYQEKRWQDAADACKAFIDANEASGNPYALVTADGNSFEDYRKAFSKSYGDRCNREVILAGGLVAGTWNCTYYRYFYGCSRNWYHRIDWVDGGVNYGGSDCTLDYVDMFQNLDGTPSSYRQWCAEHPETIQIDDETYHVATINENPFFTTLDNQVIYRKDPRLYESVMVVGDRFRDRGNTPWTRRAEMWFGGEDRGDGSEGHKSGFSIRKFCWDYDPETMGDKPVCWPVFRLPEIYLSYAEALNELGQFDEALKWLNKTRERVGMPPMTAELLEIAQPDGKYFPEYPDLKKGNKKLREEIIDERAREFCLEDCRWFDIARWKRGDILTKRLYGIGIRCKSYTPGSPDIPENAYLVYGDQSYMYELYLTDPKPLYQRAWQISSELHPKWFLSAFPPKEINKGYGLVQNPGW